MFQRCSLADIEKQKRPFLLLIKKKQDALTRAGVADPIPGLRTGRLLNVTDFAYELDSLDVPDPRIGDNHSTDDMFRRMAYMMSYQR